MFSNTFYLFLGFKVQLLVLLLNSLLFSLGFHLCRQFYREQHLTLDSYKFTISF